MYTHSRRTVSKLVTVSISLTVWWPWIRVWLPERQWRRWGQIWPCTRWSSGCTLWSEDTGPASPTDCCLPGSSRTRSCSFQRPVGEMQQWNTAKTVVFSLSHVLTKASGLGLWAFSISYSYYFSVCLVELSSLVNLSNAENTAKFGWWASCSPTLFLPCPVELLQPARHGET